jgi:hypothetical protein
MDDRGAADKTAGVLAVGAGLIAAVKLARVDSRELDNRSPRVRSAISDSITIAKMGIADTKARQWTDRCENLLVFGHEPWKEPLEYVSSARFLGTGAK